MRTAGFVIVLLISCSLTGNAYSKEGSPVDSALEELALEVADNAMSGHALPNLILPSFAVSLLLTAGGLKAYRRFYLKYEAKKTRLKVEIESLYKQPIRIDENAFRELDDKQRQINDLKSRQSAEIKALENFKDRL